MNRILKFRAWEKSNNKMYECIVGNTDTKDDKFICPLIWIEYDNGTFMVRDVDKVRYNNRICNEYIGSFDISKWRVIGNIYENKELFLNI